MHQIPPLPPLPVADQERIGCACGKAAMDGRRCELGATHQLLTHERPCAAPGLISYRYRGRFGWIMIGARDDDDALREAARSTDDPITLNNLECWSATAARYVAVLTVPPCPVPLPPCPVP